MGKKRNEGVAESNRRRARHGHSGGENKPSKVYLAWRSMRTRCDDVNGVHYHRYGGRGITYDAKWAKFENFLADVGEPPTPNHSLDRIDNDKGYFKSNVRWASKKEQSNNTKQNTWVKYEGKRMTLAEWARHLEVPYHLLINRWVKGKRGAELLQPRLEKAHTPAMATFNGQTKSLKEWAKASGIAYATLYYRYITKQPLFK